jgi:hypothetical protein
MKKALAILSAVALVSFAAFAEDAAAAAPATLAPTVTGGIDVTAEVNLASGNTVVTNEAGTLQTTNSTATSKADAVGLKANRFKTIDWVNFDWSKASIKVEGRYDAYKTNGDDWSYLKTTSTWKDFFGFAIKHEFSVDNKEFDKDNKQDGLVDFNAQQKNFTNQVTASIAKDAITFSAAYDADDIFGILNIGAAAGPGTKLEQIFTGFRQVNFEYSNDEVYAKLAYKNAAENKDITNADKKAFAGANQIDAAIIEGKKFFGVWTVRLNDSAKSELRLGNLGSDSKYDLNTYAIGDGIKIQESDAAKKALNVVNTLTPIEGLTIKAHAIVPSNQKTVALGDWLKGDTFGTNPNLNLEVQYALANVGTFDLGTSIKQDYVVSDGTTQGLSKYFGYNDKTDGTAYGALTANSDTKHWGSALWLDAKLDKVFGAESKNAVYVGFDTQFGEYKNVKKIAENAAAGGKINEIVSNGANKNTIYVEGLFPIALDTNTLTLSAGLVYAFGTGYDYAAATGSTVSWADAPTGKPAGSADTTYFNNWTAENDATVNFYGISNPLKLKLKGALATTDATFKKVYLANEFTALATKLDLTVAGMKAIKGWADKDTVTLGTDLGVTKNGTLNVEGGYNLFLGVPTADQLYLAGTSDYAKKQIKAGVEAKYGSGDFSPFTLKVGYSIKF